MVVGIIAASNIRYSPYINFYTRLLDEAKIPYELIIPQRKNVTDDFNGTLITLPWNRKLPTLLAYREYAGQVKKVVRGKKYDFLIVLTTNMAVFLGTWLKRHYSNRYVVDVRDYTHENIKPFYYLEKIAMRYAAARVISSEKFKTFLPDEEYYVCHNLPNRENKVIGTVREEKSPIRIGYLGTGSYIQPLAQLVNLAKDDGDFKIGIYGPDVAYASLQEALGGVVPACVEFFGPFTPSEKPGILEQVDILFNLYGSGTPLLDYALSNKLYDALIHNKPILTCHGTYMETMAGPLAYSLDVQNAQNLDDLKKWYWQLDKKNTMQYAENTLSCMQVENQRTHDWLIDAIRKCCE